ncbi:choline transporter-like protein 2 isoform X1 [Daphnia pulex]|uniref:choline transporter-like protein 2 isoform X1 n=1 Tax=Daphnia pulex TaxID=6669 RepID=UPI001EE11C3E|nr:choline transporter-like protein 2 isoform X1 [Daphnia pulex]
MTKVEDQSGMVHRGPVKNRSCTDIFCLIIFIAFLVGWGIIGFYGFTLGDPQRLLHPTDSNGKICGVDETVKDKPNLFYFDLTRCADPSIFITGCPTPQVCVKSCPTENFLAIASAAEKGDELIKTKLKCKENVTLSQFSVKQLVDQGLCASYYLQSEPIAGRCIPSLTNMTTDSIIFSNPAVREVPIPIEDIVNGTIFLAQLLSAGQTFDRIFQDYSETWWIILIGLAVSMIISLFWIVLMRFAAGFMVWLSILAILALQGFGFWYCFTRYTELKEFPGGNNQTLAQIAFTTNLGTYLELKETWLAFVIILGISMVVIVLMLIFLRNRIRIAIALIGHASKAVASLMSTLVFPIFPWVFQVLVIGYFGAVALYAASIGKSTFKVVGPDNMTTTNCSCTSVIDSVGTCIPLGFEQICSSQCPGAICKFFETGGNFYVTVLQIYNLFGLFWGLFFVSALSEMVLAGAFASWYWAFDKSRDVPFYSLTNSFFRTIFYHMGTVAFGSLIIAIIRSVRVLLEYLDRKVREYSDTSCSRAMMCLCKCCFWMLEKFMRFVNRNAYVLCAINGTGFCESASEAFSLLLRNVVRVAVLDKVTDFLLFIGRLVIVTSVGILSFYVFTNRIHYINEYLPPTHYYMVPIITTVLGAYFISGLFFSVYAMAIDTIFICFLQDTEMNDGSPEKPFYMSQELMEILGKKNKS